MQSPELLKLHLQRDQEYKEMSPAERYRRGLTTHRPKKRKKHAEKKDSI